MTVYIVVMHTPDGPENQAVYSSKSKADAKCAELIEEYDFDPDHEEDGCCWVEEEVVID